MRAGAHDASARFRAPEPTTVGFMTDSTTMTPSGSSRNSGRSVLHRHTDLESVLLPLRSLEKKLYRSNLPGFEIQNHFYSIPRFLFVGPGNKGTEYIRLGIFAGIHGDEEAGVLAAVEFARQLVLNPEWAQGYEIFFYPICNPSGLEDRTRHSRKGKDLNREFWSGSREPEVQTLETELKSLNFHGIISLHADDTSDGLYGFVGGSELTRHVLMPALLAAENVLPRNIGKTIDGFEAANGIIDKGYQGVLSAPEDRRSNTFEIVFETPQLADMNLQIEANLLALKAVLKEYRGFISMSQNL